MTSQELANAANIALYVTLPALALAMLAFALHLATQGRQRAAAVGHQRELELAGAGAVTDAGSSRGRRRASGADTPGEPPEPTRRWGVLGLQLTWLATFGLVVSIACRGLAVGRPPVGNMFEFALAAAAFALIFYSIWSLRSERLWMGVFVTGVALLVLGVAVANWYVPAGDLLPSLDSTLWLVVHVTVATLTIGLLILGFVVAALYLLQDRAEQRGSPTWGWLRALPRAAVLERTTHAIHVLAFPLWTFTVIAGAIWAEHAWGRYWGWDAKEVWSFVIWVVYAAYLHAHATTGWTARKATWLAVAGFGCIIINYTVVNTVFAGMHSYSGL